MFVYHASAIADFAKQLHRGPARLRLRQLLNIEFLLTIVEGGRKYPFDFVVHGVTGFRPRAEATAALLDGGVLREDLVTLAEDISEDADIAAETYPEPLFSLASLAERFDVSTKTIFRWRRRGLVGWKFRYSDRRKRLAFPERCVRRFVAENAALVERGSSFSQLSVGEREQVVSRARGLFEQKERSVNAIARQVAGETGRAVETIRLILKHYDDAHPKAGIFNRVNASIGTDTLRLALWEAYVDGESLENLARRFERPIAWVYKAITQMRARDLKARKIEYVPSAEFDQAGAAEAILAAPAAQSPWVDAPARPVRAPADLPPYLQQLFRTPLLSVQGEVALFRKMNFLKWQADQARQELEPETVSAAELDRVEALLAEAKAVHGQITEANLRLVVSIAKRHVSPGHDFFEIISDGNLSLMRAVDKFDYSRGFKFSTYASWAIMKNYARTIPEQRVHRDHYQTGREELLEGVAGPRFDDQENDFLPAVRSTLDRMLGTLDERERSILRQRFGLDDQGEPQTLEQIGKRLGVSKERIRQLEARAMTKLREDFNTDVRQLLGS